MKKFVSLHNHTTFSLYDGIGYPEDYIQWNLKNAGEDSGAIAFTDHGHLNAAGFLAAAQSKYQKKGIPAKVIYGCEFYFLPSLSDWKILRTQKEEEKKYKKRKVSEELDDSTDLVIENEKESKAKYFDPYLRRNHLVIFAINQVGLKNLFRLISRSYREGFYRKPRIDIKMLKELNEGLAASTACVAGIPSWVSMQYENDLESALKIYDAELLPIMEIFGKDRFFLELQFNKLPEQKLVNQHLIEYSKRTHYNLIVTADSHYPSPNLFRDREIYKLLGFQMKKENIDLSILNKSIDEMECDLYLKNGDQIFESYKKTFADVCTDEKLIIDAIERTHSIAHDLVEDVYPDSSIKLPKNVLKQSSTPFEQLKTLCIKALKDKNLDSNKAYVDRAIYELKVIKSLKVEDYFLTLKEILDSIRKEMLTGTGRGSGAGSLVCYLLNITFIDPIKHNLLFERFLSASRAEMPDIDSDVESKEQAFEIVKARFGNDDVVAISNWNKLQLKSLVKDISRLYEVPFEEVNEVTKNIELEARDKILAEVGNDQKLYELTYERALKYSPTLKEFMNKYPNVAERIVNLYQQVKSQGKHAGGLIVADSMESCLPIIRIRDTDQSPVSEGISAQHLKYFGVVKYDVLGLATLRIIHA